MWLMDLQNWSVIGMSCTTVEFNAELAVDMAAAQALASAGRPSLAPGTVREPVSSHPAHARIRRANALVLVSKAGA